MRRLLGVLFGVLLSSTALADHNVQTTRREPRGLGSFGLRANGISLEGGKELIGFGLVLRLNASEKWSLEGAADIWQEGTFNSSLPVSVSAIRYIFPNLPISLYGLAGVGASIGSVAEADSSRLFGNLGFGAELRFRRWSVSGDVRYLMMEPPRGRPVVGEGFFTDSFGGRQFALMLGRRF